MPYAFADFINPGGAPIAQRYRESFVPARGLDDPETAVAVWVVCADTEEEAERLALSSKMTFSLLRRGRLIPVPPPEAAERYFASRGGSPAGAPAGRRSIVGTPTQVREGVESVAREYGAGEVIVVTITFDHDARKRSYELLAEAFGLPGATISGARAGAAG